MRIGLEAGVARHAHRGLGTRRAAGHRAVVNQRDLHAEAGRRQASGNTGNTTADNHQFIVPFQHRRFGQPKQLAAPRRRGIVRRGVVQIGRKQNRIATAFETGQVVQLQRSFFLVDFNNATVLPVPIDAFRSENRFQRFVIDEHLELARSIDAALGPLRHPVAGAHPHAVFAGRRYLDGRLRILHRTPQAVRQEEGRAHLIHELRVVDPAASVLECFGLDQHGRLISMGRQRQHQPAKDGDSLLQYVHVHN